MTATETFTAEGGTVTDPAPQTESSLLSSDERDGSSATGKEASDTELRGDQRSSKSYGPFEVRMLCPLKLIGGFIGKKGDNVRALRRQLQAEVLVEELVPGCSERVVAVRSTRPESRSGAGAALVALFAAMHAAPRAGGADEALPPAGSQEEALPAHASVRLLVDGAAVGRLVGRRGATINETTAASGASIRILSRAQLPPCALVSEETVLLAGSGAQVAAALRLVGDQLAGEALLPGGAAGAPPPLLLAHAGRLDPSLVSYAPLSAVSAGEVLEVEAVFELLVPGARMGNVIGRGGESIRRLRADTGAGVAEVDPLDRRRRMKGGEEAARPGTESPEISSDREASPPLLPADPPAASLGPAAPRMHACGAPQGERVLVLSSVEEARASHCAALDALVRAALQVASEESGVHRLRLLAPAAAVGGLLGRRGASVAQLRAESGASVRVLPADEDGAGGDDDVAASYHVVQIEGSLQSCVAALRGAATLLRNAALRARVGARSRGAGAGDGRRAGYSLGQADGRGMGHASALQPASPGADARLGPRTALAYALSSAQVGAVLGKGGQHISQIRSLTGARLHLADADAEGRRALRVQGAPEACQAAHNMVNAFLAMGRCPAAAPIA